MCLTLRRRVSTHLRPWAHTLDVTFAHHCTHMYSTSFAVFNPALPPLANRPKLSLVGLRIGTSYAVRHTFQHNQETAKILMGLIPLPRITSTALIKALSCLLPEGPDSDYGLPAHILSRQLHCGHSCTHPADRLPPYSGGLHACDSGQGGSIVCHGTGGGACITSGQYTMHTHACLDVTLLELLHLQGLALGGEFAPAIIYVR